VSMTVEEIPVLSVSPTSLDFGTSSTSKTFSISNSGTGTLSWNVSESVSWITSVSPSSGSNDGTVTVQVSRSGMSLGSFNGAIYITSNGGNESINVSMTIEAKTWSGYADEDATIYSAIPNYNTGDSQFLVVSYEEGVNGVSEMLIDFNLASDIPSGSIILEAELRLSNAENSFHGTPFNVYIGWINAYWSENSVTWDNFDLLKVWYATSRSFTIPSTTGNVYFDVTYEVQRILDEGYDEGFCIWCTEFSGIKKDMLFHSSESSAGNSKRPYLYIKYKLNN